MALSTYGPALDLHAGGADLWLPHHAYEAVRAEAATGVRPIEGGSVEHVSFHDRRVIAHEGREGPRSGQTGMELPRPGGCKQGRRRPVEPGVPADRARGGHG